MLYYSTKTLSHDDVYAFLDSFLSYSRCSLIAGQWKLYEKAGQEGWRAIIPIYNTYILLKIVGMPGWWLLLLLIPVDNIVFAVWAMNMLSKSFGKDEGFTAGLIFLSFIFIPILDLAMQLTWVRTVIQSNFRVPPTTPV